MIALSCFKLESDYILTIDSKARSINQWELESKKNVESGWQALQWSISGAEKASLKKTMNILNHAAKRISISTRARRNLFSRNLPSQLYCSLFPKIIKLMSRHTLSLPCLVFFVKGVHLSYFDEAHATDVANIESSSLLKFCFITFIKLL